MRTEQDNEYHCSCGEPADFVLDDGTGFCASCMKDEAERVLQRKTEAKGLDELDIVDLMMKEKISRQDAIKKLQEEK